MKLYAIIEFQNNEVVREKYDLTSFSFFQRSSAAEFMRFTAKTMMERMKMGERASLKQDNYLIHCYRDSKCIAFVTDEEYSGRLAFGAINSMINDQTNLDTLFLKYSDPKQTDSILKVQNELDETKIILHNTINAVLERGEKLDDLVNKSNALSMQSKAFYKTAKRTNSCCKLM